MTKKNNEESALFLLDFLTNPSRNGRDFSGNYKWAFVSPIDQNVHEAFISFESGELLMKEDDFQNFLISITQAYSTGSRFLLQLKAFPGRKIEDGWERKPNSVEEVRGWVVEQGNLKPLNSQEIKSIQPPEPILSRLFGSKVQYLDA